MVLQRIQTVYLFLATVLMAVFALFPVFQITNEAGVFVVGALPTHGVTSSSPLLMCVDILIALLCFITIFKYKNLKLQIKLTSMIYTLIVAQLVTIAVMAFMQQGATIMYYFTIALPVVAMLLVVLARRGMKRDRKILIDSERIR